MAPNRLSDFDYDLPSELIAQVPAEPRDASRLLCLPRQGSQPVGHRMFSALPELLSDGDLLVLNDTRVMPARLYGRKETGGKVEILLDRPLGAEKDLGDLREQRWLCLVRASKPLRSRIPVHLARGAQALWLDKGPGASAQILLRWPGELSSYLEANGRLPLPAYIQRNAEGDHRDELDRRRYQTVFAERPGAVAAPTAGLHFTDEILASLAKKGIAQARVTLHVGPGTFLPVRSDDIESHVMHAERFAISPETVQALAACRKRKGRVVAVGTTVVRCLEAAWGEEGLEAGTGLTDLFIRPGYPYRAVDGMLTNFHLPRSTLLMLVSAFAGTDRVLAAYREAVAERYRFYSYGDAMLIL